MKNKIVIVLCMVLGILFAAVSPASAHVGVKPGEVGVGERTNFTVSVPTEEEDPTVQVRLLIPSGIQNVAPLVKPGWNVTLVKTGEDEEAKVTEIIWSGGSIPAEQRDEFVFNAQAPADETELVWKAYQTYGDGDIVAWENSPEVIQEYAKNNPPKEKMVGTEDDHDAPRPYSVTKVINDLKASSTPVDSTNIVGNLGQNNIFNTLSVAAIVVSVIALGLQFKKRK